MTHSLAPLMEWLTLKLQHSKLLNTYDTKNFECDCSSKQCFLMSFYVSNMFSFFYTGVWTKIHICIHPSKVSSEDYFTDSPNLNTEGDLNAKHELSFFSFVHMMKPTVIFYCRENSETINITFFKSRNPYSVLKSKVYLRFL